MKKLLLLAGVILAMGVNAQSNNVNVKIILHDVQSIKVIGSNVTLNYVQEDDYLDGVSKEKSGHIQAFSTKAYFITSRILADNILQSGDVSLNGVVQTLTPQNLFASTSGRHVYDVEYKAKGNDAYLNETKQAYNYVVQYSIEPQ